MVYISIIPLMNETTKLNTAKYTTSAAHSEIYDAHKLDQKYKNKNLF